MTFPAAVPEIPTTDVRKAVAHYVNVLGFNLDWHAEDDGIAGISRGECRLFLADPAFRESHGNRSPMLSWLNLANKAEVDALYSEWRAAKATIASAPEDKPWNLREFTVADLDGNLIRVFYDFTNDES